MAGAAKHTETAPPGDGDGRDSGRGRRGEAFASRAAVPGLPAVGMDSVAAAVLVCSADGIIVDLNGVAATLLHVERAEALGTPLTEVRQWAGTWVTEAGECIGPSESTLARLGFDGQRVESEVVGVLAGDGAETTWLRISAKPLFSPTGALENVVLTLVDITALKETKDALERTAADLGELIAALPDTYVYVDASDVVGHITGARAPGHGVPRAFTRAGIGEPFWASLSEDAAGRLRRAAVLARATGKPVTAEIASFTPASILYDEVRHFPHDDGSLMLIVRDITENRRAAEALRQSEENYRTLYLRTPVMLHSIDGEGRLLSVSDRWLERLGYTAEEVLGRHVTDFLTEESRRVALEESLPRFFATGRAEDHAEQMVAKDGSTVDVVLSATSERDGGGNVIRSLAVLVDITELRTAEHALREREQMLSAVIASLPGAVYRGELRAPWRTTFLSEGFLPLLDGYPETIVAGEVSWADFVHPDDLHMLSEDTERDLAAGSPTTQSEYRVLGDGGEPRWVLDRAMFVRDTEGEPVELIGMLFDVTDLHGALAAQAESERRLRTVIDNIPGMVYRSQAVAPWSDEFIAGGDVGLTGYSVEELTSPDFRWDQVMHPEDVARLEEASRIGAETGRGQAEYRIRAKDGAERWLLDRFTFLKDERGIPIAQEGILVDVTEQHRIEDELRSSRGVLELHARIATIFLTAAPDRMFTEALGVIRQAMDARWGFFGYLDADGALVAPSVDAEVWEACGVEGRPMRFPQEEWSDNAWSRAIRTKRPQLLEGRSTVPEGHLPIARALATPIVHGEESIGVLILAERDTAFDDADVRLMEDLAATIAPVLHEWRERMEQESAREEAERALRESEQRYRSLYDGSPVGVFMYDAALTFLEGNAALAEILGEETSRYAGRRIPDVVTQPAFLTPLEDSLQARESIHEGPFGAADGRRLWLTLKAAPRYDADGRIVGGTAVLVDRTKQRESEEQVRHLLLHDPVSGLANRSLIEDRIGQALKHAQRKRLSISLAAFRVDRFDTVESSLGHTDIGLLLKELGRRLQQAGRAEDTVAYLGSGAFAALLPGAAGPTEATAAVSGLLTAVSEPLPVDHHELFLSVSLGVAIYPTDGATTGELMHNADTAMRQASDAGGDRWQFFHPGLNEEQADRLALDAELHRALAGDQFFLEYQPLVAATTEEIIGVESLVRWRHPERGVLQPMDFIPVAEDSGVLTSIGEWVLREACMQGRAWQRQFGKPLRMAVNMSARQLHDEGFVDMVRHTLRATGFDAHALELEVTETAAMRDARHTAQILGALRTMGVRVALDDFGTGYSSLSHLVRLPISTVKIDRSFVRDLLTVPEHAAVAASVIALGHRLELTVVAEGVETIGERGALKDEGCDVIQGFLYSRAVPAPECTELLRAGAIHR